MKNKSRFLTLLAVLSIAAIMLLLSGCDSIVDDIYSEIESIESSVNEGIYSELEEALNTFDSDATQGGQTETAEKSTFRIRFIDVGQADSAIIECDGRYMLIDGGNRDDSELVYSVLEKANIDRLDIVVATHAHEDHAGGIAGALNYASADLILCPVKNYDTSAFRNFVKQVKKVGGKITVPKENDEYRLGSAFVKVLAVNSIPDSEVNNSSIVLKITYGETSFLFAGDAEREVEYYLTDGGVDVSATLLKVGHHGSNSSSTYRFLREVNPKYAVIPVGVANEYGYPKEKVLSRLSDIGAEVYRTDIHGSVYCESDGRHITISVEKNAPSGILENDGIGFFGE